MSLLNKLETITLEQANQKEDYAVVELDDSGRILMYSQQNVRWFAPEINPADIQRKDYFISVAPCTNNFMFKGRFERMVEQDVETEQPPFDYTFTYAIKPTKVTVVLARTENKRNFVILKRR